MRVLVCGGRGFRDWRAVWEALDAVHAATPIEVVIEGGATGADRHARDWATGAARPVPVAVSTYAADWAAYGRRAGMIRNAEMLSVGRPDLVVAFPGGAGTADMVRRAKKAGVKVQEVRS